MLKIGPFTHFNEQAIYKRCIINRILSCVVNFILLCIHFAIYLDDN